ncbi:MAG: hypothetical protein GKR88_02965 [Flavobacteriaceae bacterium]|nr:MAG: hypothetical protein GKR88_02965 [Flavobacteriaceae bacterium]
MEYFTNRIIIFLIILVFYSCEWKTSTPEKYLNKNEVSKGKYKEDVKNLKELTLHFLDSIGNVTKPKSKVSNLETSIDTIFYGNDNKIVFLAITKMFNPYVKLKTGEEYQDGIDYDGGCFIGKKDSVNGNIKIIYRVKYSVGSDESDGYLRVKNKLGEIYFREMEYIDGRYNINDMRFWDSKVWEEAEIMKQKWKSYEEMKKKNPKNVYPR